MGDAGFFLSGRICVTAHRVNSNLRLDHAKFAVRIRKGMAE